MMDFLAMPWISASMSGRYAVRLVRWMAEVGSLSTALFCRSLKCLHPGSLGSRLQYGTYDLEGSTGTAFNY